MFSSPLERVVFKEFFNVLRLELRLNVLIRAGRDLSILDGNEVILSSDDVSVLYT